MRNLLMVLCAPLLISCSVVDKAAEISLSMEVPESWIATVTSTDAVTDRWWTGFNDPVLNEIVKELLSNNLDIKQAAARIESAKSLARIAGADAMPHFGVSGLVARGKDNIMGKSITSSRFGMSLDLSWEIDLWGRIQAKKRAAVFDVRIAEYEFRAARLSLTAQTIKAWFAISELRLQHELAETTVKTYEKTLQIVKKRFDSGAGNSLEVRLASANLASARALLQLQKKQLAASVRQLETLLGRYPSGLLSGKSYLPKITSPIPAGIPSELLERRPDLVAAKFRVYAADVRIKEAEASLLPQLSLTANGGSASSELSDILGAGSGIWNIAGNLLKPLFQGGRLRANVDLRKSTQEEALSAYFSIVLNAFGEVESALAAEQFLKLRAKNLSDAVQYAYEARNLAEKRYKRGLDNFLPLLEAQRAELAATSRLLSAKLECLNNRVNLHLALGGNVE